MEFYSNFFPFTDIAIAHLSVRLLASLYLCICSSLKLFCHVDVHSSNIDPESLRRLIRSFTQSLSNINCCVCIECMNMKYLGDVKT